MTELELRQMFKNLSDCYADTRSFENDGSYTEGEVIQAMTEDRFIEALKEAKFITSNTVLPAGVSRVDVNAKWECCKCGWVGKHSDSADKTPVVNDAWLLVCPKCGNKDEFYACR